MGYTRKDRRNIASQESKIRRLLSSGESSRLIRIQSISESERYTLSRDSVRLHEYYRAIEAWKTETVAMLKVNAAQKSSSLAASVHANIYKDQYGVITRIGFGFSRHGVYLHYGAGKSYSGRDGSKWMYQKLLGGVRVNSGIVRHTSPDSMVNARMGLGSRKSYDWFDSTIRSRIDELGGIVGEYFATMVINDSDIYIEKNS